MSRAVFDARRLQPAVLVPPPSKSDAQRALVLAHALGRPELVMLDAADEALPADVRRLRAGMEALGAGRAERLELDVGDGGAPYRFLLTQAAITPGKVSFVGTQRLAERPHQALIDALLATLGPSGLRIVPGAPWPVQVSGATARAAEPVFRIDASQSSQYASSLLLGCAALSRREARPWAVELQGALASTGYLELTLQWLERAGFEVARTGARFEVRSAREPGPLRVPGDWSSLGYLLLIAWRTGSEVAAVDLEADHPDREVVRVLRDLGLRLEPSASGRLRVTGTPTGGLTASGAVCPDLLPTLAALACVLPAPSRLTEVEILRDKESDRLEGIIGLVSAVGGEARHLGDTLELIPPARLPERFAIDPRGDHRMAMSAATLAVLAGCQVELTEPECVAKSFPAFWTELEKLAARLQPA